MRKIFTAVLGAVVIFTAVPARAAGLTRVSDTMSTATSGENATHLLEFKLATALQAGDTIEVDFSPLVAAQASAATMAGISAFAVDAADDGVFETSRTVAATTAGGDIFSIDSSEKLTVTLSAVDGGIPAGAAVRLTVDSGATLIGNPSAGEYLLAITTRRGGAALDVGAVAIALTTGVTVTAKVGSVSKNPTISNQFPSGTVVIAKGTSRTISLDFTDQENDQISYTITPDVGAVTSGIPDSPLAAGTTDAGVTVSFAYFAPGTAQGQLRYIVVTADDGVSPDAGVTSYSVPVWIY